jgi:hypothetical protein
MQCIDKQNWLPWGTAADIADVEEKMAQATCYNEWKPWAEQLDVLKGELTLYFTPNDRKYRVEERPRE